MLTQPQRAAHLVMFKISILNHTLNGRKLNCCWHLHISFHNVHLLPFRSHDLLPLTYTGAFLIYGSVKGHYVTPTPQSKCDFFNMLGWNLIEPAHRFSPFHRPLSGPLVGLNIRRGEHSYFRTHIFTHMHTYSQPPTTHTHTHLLPLVIFLIYFINYNKNKNVSFVIMIRTKTKTKKQNKIIIRGIQLFSPQKKEKNELGMFNYSPFINKN